MEFWASASSPNVVGYYGSFVEGSILYIIMEYMSAGSCYEIIRYGYQSGIGDELVISSILYEVVKALAYFHSNRQIHRDIKAGNILINQEGEVKIGDFGIAANLVENGTRKRARFTVVGTPCYMAPEILKEESGYTEKADIWSLGITAIELALGEVPYAKLPTLKVILNITTCAPPHLPDDSPFSSAFKDFVKACLVFQPSKRPSAEELLEHKFFKAVRKQTGVVKKFVSSLPSLSERFIQSHKNVHIEPQQKHEKELIKFDLSDGSDSNPAETIGEMESADSLKTVAEKENETTLSKSFSTPVVKSITKRIGKFTITKSPTNSPSPGPSSQDEDAEIDQLMSEVCTLKARVEALRTRNATLESQVSALEEEVAQLGSK